MIDWKKDRTARIHISELLQRSVSYGNLGLSKWQSVVRLIFSIEESRFHHQRMSDRIQKIIFLDFCKYAL